MRNRRVFQIFVVTVIALVGITVIGAYALGLRAIHSAPEIATTRVAQGVFAGEGSSIAITQERTQAISPSETPRSTTGPLDGASLSTDTVNREANDQIAPYAAALACEEHDPKSWHDLWNPNEGCHYAHTHNANPAEMDAIFGPFNAVTRRQISYPWETPQENARKHEGYKWATIANPECTVVRPEHGCIRNFRVEFHVVGTTGAISRFHSFWLEAELEDGGILRTGGHNDFGYLCVPYKGEHVPLPGLDPTRVNCNVPPYRGHAEIQRAANRGAAIYTWNSQAGHGWGEIVSSFDFQSRDDFAGIDATDPEKLELICPNFDCSANHSTMLVYELVVNIPRSDFRGFTDVKGGISPACTEAGSNCVPLVIENARPGTYSFRVRLHPNTPHTEFDIYFGKKPSGWIEYPN